MVLRPFALSLLVPDRYYRRVRSHVERKSRYGRALVPGNGLTIFCVLELPMRAVEIDQIPSPCRSSCKSKPKHELSPWVRDGEIARRFDYHCCETDDEFNDVERLAMTRNPPCEIQFRASPERRP